MMLPSKKVLSVLVLSSALVASLILTFGKEKSSQAINFASNLVAGEKISLPKNSDWQLELQNVPETKSAELPQEQPSTETETVSQSLVSNYLVLKQSGKLDSTSAQNLVDQTLEYISKTDSQAKKITELNIVPDNGIQSIREYGENLGNILKYNRREQSRSEIVIMQDALTSRNPEKIKELEEAVKVYEKILNELVIMPVPKTFTKAHYDTILGMQTIISGLQKMLGTLNDPVVGLQGLKNFQEGVSLFVQAVQASSKFIIGNNVVYEQGSGGYYLLYGI